MDKLLHERLREVVDRYEYPTECTVCREVLGLDCLTDSCTNWITKLAEEIERCYTPLVLDADGVPINAGDTLYRISDGYECLVIDVYRSEKNNICFRDSDGLGFVASAFTHEKPVFDADGVIVRKGDTVYLTDDGSKWICDEPNKPGMGFLGHSDLGRTIQASPTCFTHREPDSLEKLCDFAGEWAQADNVANSSAGDYRDAMQEIHGRLTALIERGNRAWAERDEG